MADLCGFLITEAGDQLVTEDGNGFLVTECFTPETGLRPGRVFRGQYPYWKPRRPAYWEIIEDEDEEIVTAIVAEMGSE